MSKCSFVINDRGRVYCSVHEQGLLYGYTFDERLYLICQVGEDEAITKSGNMFTWNPKDDAIPVTESFENRTSKGDGKNG